jgi:hypothetical protein
MIRFRKEVDFKIIYKSSKKTILVNGFFGRFFFHISL